MIDGALHAAFNASLNFLSGVLLVVGYRAIKSGARATHKKFMLGTFSVSALFLVSYAIRFVLAEGPKTFPGEGLAKAAYLGILFSHMILAMAVPVMAVVAVRHALNDRFDAHKRWARPLFPIWVYVSVTGVVVYAMLYHWPA